MNKIEKTFVLLLVGSVSGCGREPPQVDRPPMVEQMNGITLVIPENRLSPRPRSFKGVDSWTRRRFEVAAPAPFNSGLEAFSIDALWPTMEPHLPSNAESYRMAGKTLDAHNWLEVSISSWHAGQIEWPAEKVAERSYTNIMVRGHGVPSEMSKPEWAPFKYDQSLGINKTQLIGENAKREAVKVGWRIMAYWSGRAPEAVSTIIVCRHSNGEVRREDTGRIIPVAGFCRQKFWMDDLRAEIEISYQLPLLPHWRAIQDKTMVLIRGFYFKPGKG